jgi:hypothetical protein
LCLRVGVLLILHRVANYKAGSRTERATDCSAGTWRTNSRADYSAGSGTDQCSYTGTLFTRAQRLTGASGQRHQHRASYQAGDQFPFERVHL